MVFYSCCCSVAQSCPILCNRMGCSTPSFPVLYLLGFAQTHVHWVDDTIQSCHPLLLLSMFPSTRAFSNELALRIRWPKYWSFSFSINIMKIQGWFPLLLIYIVAAPVCIPHTFSPVFINCGLYDDGHSDV